MTFFADLSTCVDFGLGEGARAVGWLDSENDFRRGAVPTAFFERLVEFLIAPWQPAAAAGRHPCPFCRFTGGPSQLSFGRHVIQLGSAILVIPSEQEIFVAPSMVAHYIDAHDYSPPQPFVEAVLKCPAMRSMPYLRLLRAHGVTAAPARTTPSDAVSE